MTVSHFERSLDNDHAPDVPGPLKALWHDANGNWDTAHEIVQDLDTQEAAWVHAYLHRKEGDLANARYWYDRAGKPPASGDLDEEWKEIVAGLLA